MECPKCKGEMVLGAEGPNYCPKCLSEKPIDSYVKPVLPKTEKIAVKKKGKR